MAYRLLHRDDRSPPEPATASESQPQSGTATHGQPQPATASDTALFFPKPCEGFPFSVLSLGPDEPPLSPDGGYRGGTVSMISTIKADGFSTFLDEDATRVAKTIYKSIPACARPVVP